MLRTTLVHASLTLVLSCSIAYAQQFPIPLRYVTSDGAWDCSDETGAELGTVVILGENYGVIGTDDKVIGYGKFHRVGEDQYDLPHYVIMDGYLKDDLGFTGTTMRGPREDYENFSTGIFFVLVKSGGAEIECQRRLVPGKLQ